MQSKTYSEHDLEKLQDELIQRGGGLAGYLDYHDLMDAIQNANIDLLKAIRGNRVHSTLSGYAYRIVHCKGARRIKSQRWDRTNRENMDTALSDQAFDGVEPIQSLEHLEVSSAIDRALMQLEYEDRCVVILRYFNSMPYLQIAEIMGLKDANAVTTRLRRAYKDMKPYLEGWAE